MVLPVFISATTFTADDEAVAQKFESEHAALAFSLRQALDLFVDQGATSKVTDFLLNQDITIEKMVPGVDQFLSWVASFYSVPLGVPDRARFAALIPAAVKKNTHAKIVTKKTTGKKAASKKVASDDEPKSLLDQFKDLEERLRQFSHRGTQQILLEHLRHLAVRAGGKEFAQFKKNFHALNTFYKKIVAASDELMEAYKGTEKKIQRSLASVHVPDLSDLLPWLVEGDVAKMIRHELSLRQLSFDFLALLNHYESLYRRLLGAREQLTLFLQKHALQSKPKISWWQKIRLFFKRQPTIKKSAKISAPTTQSVTFSGQLEQLYDDGVYLQLGFSVVPTETDHTITFNSGSLIAGFDPDHYADQDFVQLFTPEARLSLAADLQKWYVYGRIIENENLDLAARRVIAKQLKREITAFLQRHGTDALQDLPGLAEAASLGA